MSVFILILMLMFSILMIVLPYIVPAMKIMLADVNTIVFLLSLIVVPFAYMFFKNWLENFRTNKIIGFLIKDLFVYPVHMGTFVYMGTSYESVCLLDIIGITTLVISIFLFKAL